MTTKKENPIVKAIGGENFWWMAETFDRNTRLRDVPEEILDRLSAVDITVKNYEEDENSLTAIALITFSFKMAKKAQHPREALSNITLLKVLAKNEKAGRAGERGLANPYWETPLYELITGEVGQRIRKNFPHI